MIREFLIGEHVVERSAAEITLKLDLGFRLRFGVRLWVVGVCCPDVEAGSPASRLLGVRARSAAEMFLKGDPLPVLLSHGNVDDHGSVKGDIRTAGGLLSDFLVDSDFALRLQKKICGMAYGGSLFDALIDKHDIAGEIDVLAPQFEHSPD